MSTLGSPLLLNSQWIWVVSRKVFVERRVNTDKPILNLHMFYLLPNFFNFSVIFGLDHIILKFQGLNFFLLL